MDCPKEVKELFEAFPDGYIDSDWDFVLVPGYEMSIPLAALKNRKEYIGALLMFVSEYVVSGGRWSWDWLNKPFRYQLRKQLNYYFQRSFTASDYVMIYETVGDGCNTALLNKFVNHGLKMSILERYITDHEEASNTYSESGFDARIGAFLHRKEKAD
ncbi:TPA: hypothetical protein TY413_000432 [Streptococcus suis]|nr:hypothetical protein [Streptococcus suis]